MGEFRYCGVDIFFLRRHKPWSCRSSCLALCSGEMLQPSNAIRVGVRNAIQYKPIELITNIILRFFGGAGYHIGKRQYPRIRDEDKCPTIQEQFQKIQAIGPLKAMLLSLRLKHPKTTPLFSAAQTPARAMGHRPFYPWHRIL